MTLARRLVELRERSNMSLQDVAESVGRSKAHIWNLEKGVSDNPSLKLLVRLAEHYRVDVGHRVGERANAAADDPEGAALLRDLRRLDARDRTVVRMLVGLLCGHRPDDRELRPRAVRVRPASAGRIAHALKQKA